MDKFEFSTPIAFIIFNRPDTTKRIFEKIREIQPKKLFIIADGPRENRPEDIEKCRETRSIVENIDWDCEVYRNYSEVNLGCGVRPATGITWVFDNVEEAIILEDDCLPDLSFFRYCQELLEKYRYDQRIMLISGNNFQFEKHPIEYSYYYSRYNHIWGWASWRRAWAKYDYNMALWPKAEKMLYQILNRDDHIKVWYKYFKDAYSNKNKNFWDYQWTFACWINNGLSILPGCNLVSNIGFGEDATHTFGDTIFSNIKKSEMIFPLNHPPFVIRDDKADSNYEDIYNNYSFKDRIMGRVKNIIRRIKE